MLASHTPEPDEPNKVVPHGKSRHQRKLATARVRTLEFAAVPPDPARCLPLWHTAVPHDSARPPLLWLLGAHGGAGVSVLAQSLAPAADCGHAWPAVLGNESPFVLLVAREHIDGLSAAHELLRQYHCGQAGKRAHLLGLITTAHHPRITPKPISRYLKVIEALLPDGGLWRVDWQPAWPVTRLTDLPTWNPDDEDIVPKHDPLRDMRTLGEQLLERARLAYTGTATPDTPPEIQEAAS